MLDSRFKMSSTRIALSRKKSRTTNIPKKTILGIACRGRGTRLLEWPLAYSVARAMTLLTPAGRRAMLADSHVQHVACCAVFCCNLSLVFWQQTVSCCAFLPNLSVSSLFCCLVFVFVFVWLISSFCRYTSRSLSPSLLSFIPHIQGRPERRCIMRWTLF